VLAIEVLRWCWIVRRCQAGVLAEGRASGLVVGQLWDCCVMLRGVSMHGAVLSRHFKKDLSLHACATVDCSSSRSY
jgi:hypothetical protein